MHEGSKGLDSHVLLVVDHKHLRVLGIFEMQSFSSYSYSDEISY